MSPIPDDTATPASSFGRALGPEIGQLNSTILYPATGRTANQLATLAAIGLFDEPIGLPSWNLTALPADFRYAVTLAETGVCDVAPTIDSLGIDDPRLRAWAARP